MIEFSQLLEKLALTPSRNRKIDLMAQYFKNTPDPDRGLALAILTDNLSFQNVKSSKLKQAVLDHIDEQLFKLSYDYVGDLGETVALIWPYHAPEEKLPRLSELVQMLQDVKKQDVPELVENMLTAADIHERWAVVKLVTGNLRIGVSARLAKTALAKAWDQDLQQIEEIWHGIEPSYADLFLWLEGKGDKPDIQHHQTFHPLMLSTPIDEDTDFEKLDPADFNAEWKWDGIRVQIVSDGNRARMYSRTGDDISHSFPDVIDAVRGSAVLDGELLVGHDFDPLSFNCLQQRLNRKTVAKAHLKDYPGFVRIYDILYDGDTDVRNLTLTQRRARLEKWFEKNPQTRLDLSEILPFETWGQLADERKRGADELGHEGVMIKKKDSVYVPGRPRGLWFKWKRDPMQADAILMYAQRGHGKRSSFYSDYTFGVWKGNEIVPIGKAYFGFTDEELKQLDKWVRSNTIQTFGPVREVKKELVFEVAFDSAHESPRHKSGIALRFPRISRIRWDKPAQEADTLENVKKLVS